MKNVLKGLSFSSKALYVLALSVAVLILYNLVAFVLVGHQVFSGGPDGSPIGSDTWSFISHLKVLNDYFPHYPFWNYLEGGGVALAYSYPILTHTLIIVTTRLVGWTLPEALKFWEYFSVIVFSMGIFTYALVRFRISILAVLAGLFYLISPIAWMWPFEWGFVAEHIAGMFFPFTVLFFDLFITRVLDKDGSFKTRLFLLLTVIFLGLSFLSHPFVFAGSIVFMLFYGLLFSLLRKKE